MRDKLLLIAVAGILIGPITASAVPITRTLDVVVSDFVYGFGSGTPAPVDPLTINFTVSFDNAADIEATTAGLTINSFNLPDTAAYAYYASGDVLTLASIPMPHSCQDPPNSFCMFIDSFSSTSPNVSFASQSTSSEGRWFARTRDASVAAIPEPATLALLGLGLAGLGFARRRCD